MVSVETVQPTSKAVEPPSSPRISFSAEFLDDNDDFISISPNSSLCEKDVQEINKDKAKAKVKAKAKAKAKAVVDFEFLSNNNVSSHTMLTADELFFEGKLLPFWQMQQSEKLNKISLNSKDSQGGGEEEEEVNCKEESNRVSWFLDDDPSPRPPKCTVLWKELLRLKKQRASSTLSPSSSSSSTSSSSSSLADAVSKEEGKDGGAGNKHVVKRIKKGLERTRSASIRIRPMINVPICTTQAKATALPPLFPLKKGRLER